MGVFRVAANANELNEYNRDYPLVSGSLPVAPYFQSSMVLGRQETVLAINDFEEDDLWVSFYVSRGTNQDAAGGRYGFALYDASVSTTHPLVGITKAVSTANLFSVRRWNGSGVTEIGTLTLGTATLNRIDIHYRAHASAGRIAVYVNGDLQVEYTGNTNSTKANRFELRRLVSGSTTGSAAYTCYSGLFLSDTDSREVTLVERRLTAVGAFDEWEGGVANVTPSNDPITTYIEAVAPDRRKSFSYATPAEISGRAIVGVILSSVQRESIEGYAPTAPFFRTSNGDIRDTDPVSVGIDFKLVQKVLSDDGGQPWTYSAVSSGQVGVLSAE